VISSRAGSLRAATIRHYLEALREKHLVPVATELTYREALADFLRNAANELGFGAVTINAELNLPLVGEPDFQVANANGAPIGYGETKPMESAAEFEKTQASEQLGSASVWIGAEDSQGVLIARNAGQIVGGCR
jgi:hypothetical protein